VGKEPCHNQDSFRLHRSRGAQHLAHLTLAAAAAALGDQVIIYFTPGAAPALEPDVLEEMTARAMPDMKDPVSGIKQLGGRFMLCELALEALHVTPDELRDDLEIVGATTFMSETRDAARTLTF
jgi:predicted peroxiredoxin